MDKNPYDVHLLGIRLEFWKRQKLEDMAAKERRSISGMINKWIDREIKKWDGKGDN